MSQGHTIKAKDRISTMKCTFYKYLLNNRLDAFLKS